MGRILAMDYGSKRVGVAETDDFQLIASPLTTIHSKDVVEFLKEYQAKNILEALVVGEPKNLDGSKTHGTELAQHFVNLIKKQFPTLEIIRIDERFTSKMAAQSMITAGVKKSKRQEKGNLDKVSAAIILQSYLDQRSKGF